MSQMKVDNIEINSQILNLIAEIDEFKGYWKAINHLTPEKLEILKDIANINSISSSARMEGLNFSNLEVKKILSSQKIAGLMTPDEVELLGYKNTLEDILSDHQNKSISENEIKKLHYALFRNVSKTSANRGLYKRIPNFVEAFSDKGQSLGRIIDATTPFKTSGKVSKLVKWFLESSESRHYHPLLITGIFIISFIVIHPFQAGNFKLAFLLSKLLLLQYGYEYMPYISLEHVIESKKNDFYKALSKTSKTIFHGKQDWQPWLILFLEILKEQKNELSRKSTQEQNLQQSSTPKLSLKILELVQDRGRVSVQETQHLTGANRNTIKLHLKNMVKSKRLTMSGQGRGVWYSVG